VNFNHFSFSQVWISGTRWMLLPVLFSIAFSACQTVKEEDTIEVKRIPVVTTLPAESWGQAFIVASASIGSDGNSGAISDRGFFYISDPAANRIPDENLAGVSKISLGAGPVAFSVKIEGLQQKTTYAIRSFARNSQGLSYGNTIYVSTTYGPIATLGPITGRAARSDKDSFYVASSLVDSGGTSVTERGFVISTLSNATVDDGKAFAVDGKGLGNFADSIFGTANLVQNKLYYVKAYARNSAGVAYSNEISLRTAGDAEIILGNIRQSLNTLRIDCRIEETGNLTLDSIGILLVAGNSTQAINFTTPNVKVYSRKDVGLGDVSFLIPVDGNFIVGNKYRIRAYVKNARSLRYDKTSSTVIPFCPIGGVYKPLPAFSGNGTIYWTSADVKQALVVMDTVLQGVYEWGCIGDSLGTSAQFNTSKTNTSTISSRCATAGIAAKAARSLNAAFDLPSLGDMSLIYDTLYKRQIGQGTYNPDDFYWTSSQTTESRANAMQFATSGRRTQISKKNVLFKVKVVTAVTF
jgi:hypothetical protein